MRLLVLAVGCMALAAQNSPTPSIPRDVSRSLARLGAAFSLGGKAEPKYQRGDFDGDGKLDLAIEVCRSGDQGLAIFLSSRKTPIVIAAGKPHFAWAETSMNFDEWSIHSKGEPVEEGVEAGPPPKLKGDALFLGWDETGSGLIYWTGKKFEWYQQGD